MNLLVGRQSLFKGIVVWLGSLIRLRLDKVSFEIGDY